MKRFVLTAVLVVFASSVFAQGGFGIKAGLNFSSMSDVKLDSFSDSFNGKTGFHVGALYKFALPLGFAIQPEFLYSQKGGSIESDNIDADVKMHYLQLPVNLQWGVDLLLFRPFLMVSPYIGYAIAKGDGFKDIKWSTFNKFEYGIGVGAGMEVWKFQLSGRYCWDLGNVGDFKDDSSHMGRVMRNAKNRGFELSLAFMF